MFWPSDDIRKFILFPHWSHTSISSCLFVLRLLVTVAQITGCGTLSSGGGGASVRHCTEHQGDSHWRASISSDTLLVNATKFIYSSAVPLIFPQTTGPNLKCANPPPSGGSTVSTDNPYLPFLEKSFSHILAHKAPAPAFVAWASI